MTCMKCGGEIPESQVFCDSCLSVMEQYPVKPDAHIHLPKRAETVEAARKPAKKKRAPSPEEQITALRIKVLRTRLLAAILAFFLCVVSGLFALKLYNDYMTPQTGRNYTIDTSMKD